MAMEGCKEIILFGARIVVDSMRKTASLNNLSDYQHVADAANPIMKSATAGYVSDNVARVASGRDRKRGTPWSEEEHKLFLMGLKKVGKGDWRGISKNFVKTRTPTQVASHAQKYFLRHTTVKSRRRASLFDITTETVNSQVTGKMTEDNPESVNGNSASSSQPQLPSIGYSNAQALPIQITPVILSAYPSASSSPSQVSQQQMKIHPPGSVALELLPSPNSNSVTRYSSLSLNLGLSLASHTQASPNPALKTMPGLMSKDSYISVA